VEKITKTAIEYANAPDMNIWAVKDYEEIIL
jgi:hypothetical protein